MANLLVALSMCRTLSVLVACLWTWPEHKCYPYAGRCYLNRPEVHERMGEWLCESFRDPSMRAWFPFPYRLWSSPTNQFRVTQSCPQVWWECILLTRPWALKAAVDPGPSPGGPPPPSCFWSYVEQEHLRINLPISGHLMGRGRPPTTSKFVHGLVNPRSHERESLEMLSSPGRCSPVWAPASVLHADLYGKHSSVQCCPYQSSVAAIGCCTSPQGAECSLAAIYGSLQHLALDNIHLPWTGCLLLSTLVVRLVSFHLNSDGWNDWGNSWMEHISTSAPRCCSLKLRAP